jgi:hypothetical protein
MFTLWLLTCAATLSPNACTPATATDVVRRAATELECTHPGLAFQTAVAGDPRQLGSLYPKVVCRREFAAMER